MLVNNSYQDNLNETKIINQYINETNYIRTTQRRLVIL